MWTVAIGTKEERCSGQPIKAFALMAEANDLSLTPHSANLGLLTLPTMPLLPTLPNAGKIVELSIEQADYYPCQYGLFRNDPYRVVDGHVTVPAERAGVEIEPASKRAKWT